MLKDEITTLMHGEKPGHLGSSGVGCSHHRSIEIYTESILSPCKFHSKECSSYDKFQTGACGECNEGSSDSASMGYHTHIAEGVNRSYFLKTNADQPYSIPTAGHAEL